MCYLLSQVPKHNYLYKLLHRLVGKEQLTLENIRQLLIRLLDRYDTQEESIMIHLLDVGTDPKKPGDYRHSRFQRPYKMLLVWAILMNRYGNYLSIGCEMTPNTCILTSTVMYILLLTAFLSFETSLK